MVNKIKDLINVLNKARNSYYNENRELMTNKEYDDLYDKLMSNICKIDSKKIKDLTGKTFNKLHVIGYIGKNKHKKSMWLCQCECKTLKILEGNEVSNGRTKSCGCLVVEKNKDRIKDNGLRNSNNRIYRIYRGMKDRCYNKNSKDYEHYGGRNICLCDEWKNDFVSFYTWAHHNGYKKNLTIDRIDVNGIYEPSNCRWVSIAIQNRNKTTSIPVVYFGKKWILKDLVVAINKEDKYNAIVQRLRKGWSIEDAINIKFKEKNLKNRFIGCLENEFYGKSNIIISKDMFSEKYNLNKNSIYDWLKKEDVKKIIKRLGIKFNKKGDFIC